MTDLQKLFPHASKSFLDLNAAGAPAADAQPAEGNALVIPGEGKAPRRVGDLRRTKIVFRIYARRPADWDGWHIKELQDVLCAAGLLDGDAWDQLEGATISEKVHTEREERTEILIEYPSPSEA